MKNRLIVDLLIRASAGVRRSLITDDQLYSYCNLVFGGWDFCITDDKAALLKKKSLKYELQVSSDCFVDKSNNLCFLF